MPLGPLCSEARLVSRRNLRAGRPPLEASARVNGGPGAGSPARAHPPKERARLAAGGGARALLFLTGGALLLAGEAAGAAFVAVGLGLFGAALLRGTCGFRRDVSGRG